MFVSEIVVEELSAAPATMREKMLAASAPFQVLHADERAYALAESYVSRGIFLERYSDDALHVAIASVNGIGILISWNYQHLVKMKTRRLVALANALDDYIPVEIISPPEL